MESVIDGVHEDIAKADPGLNHVVLTGQIAADPRRGTGRRGEPITVMLISFAAADEKAFVESACLEVEVLDEIADRHREALQVGASILVSGELTREANIWAKLLSVGNDE